MFTIYQLVIRISLAHHYRLEAHHRSSIFAKVLVRSGFLMKLHAVEVDRDRTEPGSRWERLICEEMDDTRVSYNIYIYVY